MKRNALAGKILFYIALGLFFVGISACVSGIVCELNNNEIGFRVSAILISICGPLALVLMIVKFMFFGGGSIPKPKTPIVKTYKYNEKDIPIVDVKEFKKSQDEIMFEKYEDLYNKKIITKEDLEKKREELLGKK